MASGYGEGLIYDYLRSLIQDGDEVTIRSTDGKTDLRTFLYDADLYDAIIASGGDGTISTIAYLLADTGIPILPFPAGTANLLTTNLLSPVEIHALAAMTRQRNVMDFDIGEIELEDGERMGFSVIAGAGYDAAIMQSAAEDKKRLGSMAYLTSAFANATPKHANFTLDIDGRKVKSDGVGVLIVNFAKIQFDLSVVHDNKPRDGYFDVVILNTKDAWGLIPAVIASALDRSGDFPGRTDALETYRGKQITVEARPRLCVQFDGEVTEHTTPFTIRMMPSAARFIVSDECTREFGGNADDAAGGRGSQGRTSEAPLPTEPSTGASSG